MSSLVLYYRIQLLTLYRTLFQICMFNIQSPGALFADKAELLFPAAEADEITHYGPKSLWFKLKYAKCLLVSVIEGEEDYKHKYIMHILLTVVGFVTVVTLNSNGLDKRA